MPPSINLIGKKVGRLSVLRRLKKDKWGGWLWICQCSCGNKTIVRSGNLTRGRCKSCGCLQRDKASLNIKHGLWGSPEYNSWHGAKQRCENPNDHRYYDYGGRGIKVLFKTFEEFFAEVGPKPSLKHTIDRIDNNGNYEPGNIRWATPKEQMSNRRVPKPRKYVKAPLSRAGKLGTHNRWHLKRNLKSKFCKLCAAI